MRTDIGKFLVSKHRGGMMVDATFCNIDAPRPKDECNHMRCICHMIEWTDRPDLKEIRREACGMIHSDSPLSRIVTKLIEDLRKHSRQDLNTWVNDGIIVRKAIKPSHWTQAHSTQTDTLVFDIEIECVSDISNEYISEKWMIIVGTPSQDPIVIHFN